MSESATLSRAKIGAWAPIAKIPCPCCGKSGARIIYQVPSIPVHSCVLLETAEAARNFPRRDLELAFCDACGFLFNPIFDEEVMGYSTNFEESQHFSDTFSSFARKLAREIAEKCSLTGKQVLEIGCGKGEFICELCAVSGASGVGIDPGYRSDPDRSNPENIRFIVDHYGPKFKSISADLVLCRHTLEHVAAVRPFLRSIRDGIGGRDDVWVVFETPDASRVLSEGAFWDIYYEHCSYFNLGTHAGLFRRERFDVVGLSVVYGDQYIVQYAKPAQRVTGRRFAAEYDFGTIRELVAVFPARVQKMQSMWLARIRSAAKRSQRIVLWGGGSKSVSFLTTLGLQDEIAAVVDLNPYRQGCFLPGSGHEVVAPATLTSINPAVVVVMNPVYLAEIRTELARLGLRPEILTLGLSPRNQR
jgi:SAM-dependent methyltransferase